MCFMVLILGLSVCSTNALCEAMHHLDTSGQMGKTDRDICDMLFELGNNIAREYTSLCGYAYG
jgi:hypothetical protein